MHTYTRSITETVTALQYLGEKDVPSDLTDIARVGYDPHTRSNVLSLQTPVGGVVANPTDWVVISPTALTIMSASDFAATYKLSTPTMPVGPVGV